MSIGNYPVFSPRRVHHYSQHYSRHVHHYSLTINDSLSPSRRREAPCEGTNSPRLFTPGETKALGKCKVHQISRAWVTVRGWSSSLISKIWRTVMNSGHWLVQFKVCIITTAWRQRNSKHFLIWSQNRYRSADVKICHHMTPSWSAHGSFS
jgi:hypothetical protein